MDDLVEGQKPKAKEQEIQNTATQVVHLTYDEGNIPNQNEKDALFNKGEGTISYPYEGNEIGICTSQHLKELMPNELNTNEKAKLQNKHCRQINIKGKQDNLKMRQKEIQT